METVQVPLTQGKFATIDAADWPLVSQYEWHACERELTWYAASSAMRRKTGECIYLHRLIVGAGPGQLVDHKDGDGLNCRRSNLRVCTNAQNCRNMRVRRGRSLFKGVAKDERQPGRPWVAYINANNRRVTLGAYPTEHEAARAYNAAALELHGEFACLNEIPGLTYEESIAAPVRNHRPGRQPRERTAV